jgi:hypothetical protein
MPDSGESDAGRAAISIHWTTCRCAGALPVGASRAAFPVPHSRQQKKGAGTMPTELIILAAMSGICGNEPIILHLGGHTPPKPEPICPMCGLVISGLFGIAAYWLWGRLIDTNTVLSVAVVAYLGGKFGGIAYGLVTGSLRARAPSAR